MNERLYDPMIDAALLDNGLGPSFAVIVRAIIGTESGFRPTAFRNEPAIGDASRGLMQILYRTARDMGFGGAASELLDPATNIRYGVKYLAWQLRRKGFDLWAAVSAYNNGNGRRATAATRVCLARDQVSGECVTYFTAQPGQFLNQPYVDKVQTAATYFASVTGVEEPPATIPPGETPPGGATTTGVLLWVVVSMLALGLVGAFARAGGR